MPHDRKFTDAPARFARGGTPPEASPAVAAEREKNRAARERIAALPKAPPHVDPNSAQLDPNARECIEEILGVLARRGLLLSHEDGQGGFILRARAIEPDHAYYERWLRDAALEKE